MSQETIITMVGPSGVGKTSLMASMYTQMKGEFQELACSFTANSNCSKSLYDREEELKSLVKGDRLTVDIELGTQPSADESQFDFELNMIGKNANSLPVKFVDLPGGWYTGQGDNKKAEEWVSKSDVIIVAVDAWALMEDQDEDGLGKYNHQINQPKVIAETLERAGIVSAELNNGKQPEQLVLFTFVKSEKYLHAGQFSSLVNAFLNAYKESINTLKMHNFKIAICGVETVGGITLLSITEKEVNGKIYPVGKFRKITDGPNKGYTPKGCSIPLRLVFKRALFKIENRSWIQILKDIWDGALGGSLLKTLYNKEWKKVARKVTEKLDQDQAMIHWVKK